MATTATVRSRKTGGKKSGKPERQTIRSPFDLGHRGGIEMWLGPFVLFLVVLPLTGELGHLAWGNMPYVLWVPFAIPLIGAGLAALAWLQSHARRDLLRWHIALSVVGGSLMLALDVALGSFDHRSWTTIWVLLGGAAAVSWLIPRTDAVRGNGHDHHQQASKADDATQQLLGLKRPKVEVLSVTSDREVYRVSATGGQTAKDVQGALPAIEALRHLPPGASRAVADPEDSAAAQLVLVKRDLLKKSMDWPGPTHPGGSVAAPIRTGVYEDGHPFEFHLSGTEDRDNPRAAPGTSATVGQPGSGKTVEALVMAGDYLTRRDGILWWSDTIKGPQSVAPILPGIDWFAGTKRETTAMLAALDRIIKARAQWLGAHGFAQWVEGCGIPFMWVQIEEAARILEDSEHFTRLTEACRSVGIYLVVSMQRPSGSNFPTDARAMLGGVKHFGVSDKETPPMVMSDYTLDAGADPVMWKNTKPGMFFAEWPGIPQDRWPIPIRAFRPAPGYTDIADAVTAWAHVRASLDPVSAAAAGQAYADRTRHITTTPLPTPGSGTATDNQDEETWDMPERPAEIAAEMEEVDHREPIDTTGLDGLTFGDDTETVAPLSEQERTAELARIIRELLGNQDSISIKAGDLAARWYELPGVTPSQRPAMYRRLTRIRKAGKAENTGGSWTFYRGAHEILLAATESDDEDDD